MPQKKMRRSPKHNMNADLIKKMEELGILLIEKTIAKHSPSNYKMKPEIRRLVKDPAKFECSVCGKLVKRAGMFEYRHPQMIIDHIPELYKQVCRVCIYKLSFGSKGIMAKKRNNKVELETPRYTNLD